MRHPNGDEAIGSAFHVGEGVFLTARHVVEGREVLEIANTIRHYVPDENGRGTFDGHDAKYRLIPPSKGVLARGPFFHPKDSIDVAALVVTGIECPAIPLGSHLDDWLADDDFMLAEVTVFGYPTVPLSLGPKLISSRAEVNAIIDKYTGGHPHFLVSAVARGGFSGGPCIVEWDFALGMVTESLTMDHGLPETGYMSVISVEPLYDLLAHHQILPRVQSEDWDGFWDKRS